MRKIIRITQGDDRWLEIPLLRDGLVQPYGVSARIFVAVKTSAAVEDADATIFVSTDLGSVIVPDTTKNIALAHFAPADTKNVTPGKYLVDIQVTLASGETQTVDKFDLYIDAEITRAA